MTEASAAAHSFGATKKAFVTALMASASLALLSGNAAAATCTAANDAQYDACMLSAATGDTVLVTGAVTHNVASTNAITIQVASTGVLTDAGGSFGGGTNNLIIDAGGSVTLSNNPFFRSLNGAGTLITTGGSSVTFDSTTPSAFSGSFAPTVVGSGYYYNGTSTFNISGLNGQNAYFAPPSGTIVQSSGTSSLGYVQIYNTANMNITGGTLNIGTPGSGGYFLFGTNGTNVVNQSGGTVNAGNATSAANLYIGYVNGNGTYNLSGGTLNLGAVGGPTTSHQIGFGAAFGNTTGTLNITGGTVNLNAGNELVNGDSFTVTANLGSSTINLSAGTLSVKPTSVLYLSALDTGSAIDSTFNLSGTGVLEVGDSGLQSGYAGGTGAYAFNLNGGTIRVIGSALTTSVNATLLGASATTGTQLDTNGIGATWNGVLSGTGWIVKTGAGTLNLGGINTYTGGTGFNGGVVFVDAFSDLGAATAGMSFSGGTLRLGANNVLAARTGATNMLAFGGTIDTNGFSTSYDGNITGTGTLTKAGAGFIDLGGNNNAHSGGFAITGGTVWGLNGNAIGDTDTVAMSAGTTFNLYGFAPINETIGALAGTGTVNLAALNANAVTLTTGNNNVGSIFNGNINQVAATGSLVKVGTGVFTINGNTNYTGLTTVNGGTLRVNGTMADSLLINALGTFGGNATVNGNVTNNGHIAPGNSPGTVAIVGNYVAGAGAVFDMEVQFANAGAPVNGVTHDRVTIGGTATGAVTLLNVVPFAPSSPAAATTGNGVELVRVVGVPASGAQFQLAAPVVQDAYQYILTYRPNFSGTDDGWFLVSTTGENMYGEAAMFTTGQAVIDACFRSEDALAFDGNGHSGRGWARAKTGSVETGADTGLDSDMNYNCGSAGVDVRVAESVRLGVSAGYASTDTNVSTPTGIGDMNGDAMEAQVYASLHHGNFFANLSVGYVAMDFQFDGAASAIREGDVEGVIGGLQVGAQWMVGDMWQLGAIGEINYDGLDCDDQCLVAGTIADTTDWSGRGTLRLDGRLYDGQLLPYVALSYSDRGELTVTNGSAAVTADTASSLLGAKLGATIMMDEQWALFVNGGLTEGLDNDVSGWDGTGGLKVTW